MELTSVESLRRFVLEQSRSKGAAGLAVALRCGGLRCAPTPLRCSGSGPSGITRCVRCALFAQTDAASQLTMRASAPALNPALLGAAEARHSMPGRAFAPTGMAVEAGESQEPHRRERSLAFSIKGSQTAGSSRATFGPKGSQRFFIEPPLLLAERRAVPGSGAVCVGEKRRHAVGARSALCKLTRRGCLSAAPAGRVASSATRPLAEHRSAVGAQHRPTQPAPLPGTARRDTRQSALPRNSNNKVQQSGLDAGVALTQPRSNPLQRQFEPQGAH